MDKIQIPFSYLRDNPCSYCGRQISGGQVFLLPDGNILCERCKNSRRPFCRNLAYEALASNFVYPCINWQNHCPNVSEWKDAPYHISKCSYGGCCVLFFAHPGSCFKGRRRFPEENQRIGLLLVPDKVLSFLTCKICRAYLNCGPVYSQSENENVCFRCVRKNGKPPNSVPNHAYENIATLFIFPCSFRRYGCEEILYFGKSAWKHEFECPCNPATAKPIPRLEERQTETPRQSLKPVHTEIPRAIFQPPRPKQQAPAIPPSRPVYRNPSPEELQPQGPVYQNQPPQEFPETSHYRTPYTQPPGQVYRNPSPEEVQETPRSSVQPFKEKKKGLILTQTGQIWATLSPNTPLMAPPQRAGEEANKEVMESLKKRQGKHRRHVNDIEGDMNRGGASDSESVSTTMSHTALTSPDLVESSSKSSSFNYLEDNNRLLNGSMMHNRLNSVDSYESDKYSEAELAGHYPVIPRHQRNNIGRVPSVQISRYDAEIASHFPGLYNLSQNRNSDTEMAGLHRWGGQRQPVGYQEAEIAGHFPIMLPRKLNSGMDTLERQSARETFLGNSALISELKVRQDFIKRNHSIKEPVQPTHSASSHGQKSKKS